MAKKKSTPVKKSDMTWHFFIPAVGGFLITWLFSQDIALSLEVGVVVLVCSFLAKWLAKK